MNAMVVAVPIENENEWRTPTEDEINSFLVGLLGPEMIGYVEEKLGIPYDKLSTHMVFFEGKTPEERAAEEEDIDDLLSDLGFTDLLISEGVKSSAFDAV